MKTLLLTATLALSCSPAFAAKPAVYPAHGQSASKQSQDDGACYAWAKQNTGIDPVVVAGIPPPPQGPAGARVGGAARGARRRCRRSHWRCQPQRSGTRRGRRCDRGCIGRRRSQPPATRRSSAERTGQPAGRDEYVLARV